MTEQEEFDRALAWFRHTIVPRAPPFEVELIMVVGSAFQAQGHCDIEKGKIIIRLSPEGNPLFQIGLTYLS
jgi:hypothetical protein